MARRQAERSDATRRAIIDAARGLFGEQGYERTRMEQIAARAGSSKGALYHHYRDKVAVLDAVYEDQARRMAGRVVGGVEAGIGPIDALRAGIGVFLDHCTEPEYRQIALVDAPAGLGWERWRQIDREAGGFGLLRGALQSAADEGLIPSEHLDARAHLLLASLTEAALLIGRSDTPEQTRAEVADLIDESLDTLRWVGDAHGR